MDEEVLATRLAEVLSRYKAEPAYRRLVVRVKELGENQRDETLQARELQRACRDLPALGRELAAIGFGDVAAMDFRHVTAESGRLVQAFNRLIEERRLTF